ncbi:valine--tRNA ligase [Buchnera aphidicola]|uniref:valine--tRNA ligase n=1 Tax=Buchnera aphidicola TaxID=9 RepID=UPI00094C82F6|nr:valine--tRNA ligase [Buchnera aphidicola]
MEKHYNFQLIEKKIQKYLKKNEFFFHSERKISSDSFCVMVPPPNITGYLHMGHAFQQTIMDVITRYHRMLGKNTLLQMGTDHAGIATQMVVERYLLRKEGKDKNSYSRKEFINKIFHWKKKSELIMFKQIKRLGHLIDWNSVRFTLDSNFSEAVKKVFITLYRDGLIYRRKKLVHWDIHFRTVISDLEVENKICQTNMWYIRYAFVEKKYNLLNKGGVIVATTRPETLLGDTALAVHPEDSRYLKYIGKYVLVPILNRIIPIISDASIDMLKGTGCVKITPAHDFHDYDIGQRNKLPMINIFTRDGKIRKTFNILDYNGKKISIFDNQVPKNLQNHDRLIARKKILLILKATGFIKKVIKHEASVPHGDRSGVILEPMLTNQWYLNAKALSSLAIQAVKEKKIIFIPHQYKNMYLAWMNNIQDWCISRQLWWGHRIPVWYDINKNIYVGENEQSIRKEYSLDSSVGLYQDPDVLDTWFSSSLWTFAGLGWPGNSEKLLTFHPTDVLVCGFDIIFFWIARMVMITMYMIKDKNGKPQIPFKTVYITGLIRDESGKKMSKSYGNILDPLDMINGISLLKLIKKRTKNLINPDALNTIRLSTIKNFPEGISAHSTDALRYTFLSLASTSRNINWDMSRLQGYQNFCNKIWNASRFVIKHIKKNAGQNNYSQNNYFNTCLLDKWIFSELNDVCKKYHIAMKVFRFDNLSVLLHKFIWHKFCDQYLELIKPILKYGKNYEIQSITYTLFHVLSILLLLLHPIMPFITIYIWNCLQALQPIYKSIIVVNSIPQYNKSLNNVYATKCMKWFQKIISVLRCIRVDTKVSYNAVLKIYIRNLSYKKRVFIFENYTVLKKMAYLEEMVEIKEIDQIPSSIIRIIEDVEIFVEISSFLDINIELQRLNKRIRLLEQSIQRTGSLLCNKQFLIRAPKHLILEKKSLLNKDISILDKINIQKKVLVKKNINCLK